MVARAACCLPQLGHAFVHVFMLLFMFSCFCVHLCVLASLQLQKERKQLEEQLLETAGALTEESNKAKTLAKTKAKHEAAISDLENRLKTEEKVGRSSTVDKN